MTTTEILAELGNEAENYLAVISKEESDTLTEQEIYDMCDVLANKLSAITNPNGPYYPSTPRP